MNYDTGKTISFEDTAAVPPVPNGLGGRVIDFANPMGAAPTDVYDPMAAGTPGEDDGTIIDGDETDDAVVPLNYCVGWLLAVSGPNKGRSYELHACQNHIGRGEECNVRIVADPAISRHQVVIVYDNVENEYAIYSDRGTAITRVNGRRLTSSEVPLSTGDVIDLSTHTTLIFVPACGDKFRWA